ncbi:S phase cyclin A-associated protein in the endoplasmic reticulum-like isoform X2 [Dreissena polymorpha]|uniref:S phase cyclin A-associated protein in the endoplasmic reticulum-like isoform X2 n=1 Tax=Dreissena polymorpha TaxID=45954 RepID=UPI002264BA1C|nr:S phase cyclin A-associated protein in the endoplasmic reticulum-like isoform X2 [Dreissena polymorpha]
MSVYLMCVYTVVYMCAFLSFHFIQNITVQFDLCFHVIEFGYGGFMTRMNTSDRVKKIVQEEGRTARNLVIYHVPVQENSQPDRSRYRQMRKPISKEQADLKTNQKADLLKSPKSDSGKKPDLRARYWKFLFDNLQRSVDAIYETCEQDESALECKEVIMMLQQSTKDFQSLIERMHVQKVYEEAANQGDRPTSIAWEVRKMSPGKSPSGLAHRTSPSPAQRVLNFSFPEQNKTLGSMPAGNSWADRVKGTVCISPITSPAGSEPTPGKGDHPVLPEPPVLSPVPSSLTESENIDSAEESDGWETVQRGGKTKPYGSPSQRSLENLVTIGVKTEHHKLTRSVSDPDAGLFQKRLQKSGTPTDKNGRIVSSKDVNELKDSQSVTKAVSLSNGDISISVPSTDKDKNGIAPDVSQSDLLKEVTSSITPVKYDSKKSTSVISSPDLNKKSTTSARKSGSDFSIIESTKKSASNADKSASTLKVKPVSNQKVTPKKTEPAKSVKKSSRRSPVPRDTKSPPNKSPVDVAKEAAKDESKIEEFGNETETENNSMKADDVCALIREKFRASMEDIQENVGSDDESRERRLDDALLSALNEENSLTVELELEHKQALESAMREEETWLQELAREENTSIDVETETESDLGNTMSSLELSNPSNLDWDTLVAEYDAKEKAGSSLSWGEMVEEADTRTPGYAVHMHEKLSSPSRKRSHLQSPTESRKRHEEKQAKAQELRDKLMQEKSERLRILSQKVEEVRAWKEELMRQKRDMIERKMAHAEEKRQTMLKSKAQKAHDEETKANEIAFINSLEAQNKRLDIMSKHQESEARLQDIQEERQRKHEEKMAKEAAVEERRRVLHADRMARLQEIQERRKIKDARVEQQKCERETERLEAVRAKEKDREERLAILNAQHQAQKQELQKKIQQKQEESSQRHMEALKQIREKAFEMSVLRHSTEDHNEAPTITPYPVKKMCTICNALITSEVYLLSHLRGKTHQQALKHNNNGMSMTKQQIETFNLAHIVNAPENNTHPKIVSEKERIKALKKRCKKLKQRMNTRGLEYENSLQGKQPVIESENKAKLQKTIRDITKYLQSTESGPWSQSRLSALDRALGELNRIFDKKVFADQTSFRLLGGLTMLCRIMQLVDTANIQTAPPIPQKSLVLTCQVMRQACKGHYDNCHYMMFSNKISVVVDLSLHQLTLMLPADSSNSAPPLLDAPPPVPPKLPYNLLGISLLQLLTIMLSCLAKNSPSTKSSEASLERMSNTVDAFTSRGNDIISYIVSVGIVDRVTQYLRMVQGPIDSDKDAADFIQNSIGLLVSLTKFLSIRKASIFEKKKLEEPTQLISTFEVTELVGIVSLLYGMLLHSGTPGHGDTPPPEVPQHTLGVATAGLRMLNYMATLDLEMMQETLGAEGTSLEFRHIASYLIWYCSHHQAEELLHEVILCVGYFTVYNTDNQMVIQSGQPPTVLQQLCALPFQYFSDPRLVNILFPTLVSCCYNNQPNTEILEQELSGSLLANFLEEKTLELQQMAAQPVSASKKPDKEKRDNREGELRMMLSNRIPLDQWTVVQQYFQVS